ncbi:hypothetical protein [Paenibacillus sp. V4I7]|uniref:hypothetical protein n=2 Tax=unclassified Paenibacillus TaxID=185978 RepID=UPI00277D3B27|nr:hypothetical protein [Paenibacillus sp. V4I7]MDQ0897535.1 hypothetical protein [Paenibacillus sp. V4I7]
MREVFDGLPEVAGPGSFFLGKSERIRLNVQVPEAVFGNHPVSFRFGEAGMSKWIELVLYEGEERMIDFGQLNEALVIFTIQLQEELDE